MNDHKIKDNSGMVVETVPGARKRADDIHAFLSVADKTIADAKKFFYPDRPREKPQNTRLSDVIDLYSKSFMRLRVKESTAKANISTLFTLLNRAEAERNGRSYAGLSGSRMDQARRAWLGKPFTQALTRRAVTLCQDSFLREVDEGDEEVLGRKLRSANSTLRQAMSVFSVNAREFYADHGIHIPEDWDFLKAKQLRAPKVFFMLPPIQQIRRLMESLAVLRDNDPSVWQAAMLAVHCGLRRGEIPHVKWDWFSVGKDRVELQVRVDGRFAPKSGKGRYVSVERHVFDDLLESRKNHVGGYVLEDGNDADTDLKKAGNVVMDRLKDHVKSIIPGERLPLHTLRKLWTSMKVKTEGISSAQKQAGHSSPNVTAEHYTDNRMPDELLPFWKGDNYSSNSAHPSEVTSDHPSR